MAWADEIAALQADELRRAETAFEELGGGFARMRHLRTKLTEGFPHELEGKHTVPPLCLQDGSGDGGVGGVGELRVVGAEVLNVLRNQILFGIGESADQAQAVAEEGAAGARGRADDKVAYHFLPPAVFLLEAFPRAGRGRVLLGFRDLVEGVHFPLFEEGVELGGLLDEVVDGKPDDETEEEISAEEQGDDAQHCDDRGAEVGEVEPEPAFLENEPGGGEKGEPQHAGEAGTRNLPGNENDEQPDPEIESSQHALVVGPAASGAKSLAAGLEGETAHPVKGLRGHPRKRYACRPG